MPSEELDKQILARAEQSISKPHTGVRYWRKWQWPFSIAASVVLVSLIYFDNLSMFSRIDDQPALGILPNQETPVVSAPEADVLDYAETSESQAELLLNKEKSNVSNLAISRQQLDLDVKKRELREQVSQSRMRQEPKQADLAENKTEHMETEQIVVTGSRVSVLVLDEPFLTGLLKDSQQIRQRLNDKSLSTEQAENLKKQLANVHQNIYDELHAYRLSNPHFAIPEKYLAVLDESQRSGLETLADKSNNDTKKPPDD